MKVGSGIGRVISQLAADSEAARINLRVQQVRERYRAAIEQVYPPKTAQLHLVHTNKVIIKDAKAVAATGERREVRTLIVYVDDPLFAAELNAQRELIKLHLLERFGEEVEDFVIRVSGKCAFREEHPYAEPAIEPEPVVVPLDSAEREFVSVTASRIEDDNLRKSLERAMTADLQWKKGETVEKSGNSAK